MTSSNLMIRFLKQVLSLCFILSVVVASESNYKIRIHKDLIAKTLSANFPVALEHIGKKREWN